MKNDERNADKFERDMAPSGKRGRPIARRHLVCGTCSSWVDFDSSGAPTPGRRCEGALACLHARGVGR